MKKLDWYILNKFIGTFLYALSLLLVIVIVFDISEKIEDFIRTKPTMHQIIFDYYLNFIPYFANLFSHLFTFIAVIFFTSRMAARTEIVAMLSSGISFNRLLVPYMLGAGLIACGSLILNNWVIPHANQGRLDFEEKYVRNHYDYNERNIHRQIEPGTYVYFGGFSTKDKTGYKFSMERFKDNQMYYRMNADHITWDSLRSVWKIYDYNVRVFKDLKEKMKYGTELDTAIALNVKDFTQRAIFIEAMNYTELNKFIADQKMKGADNVEELEFAKQSRIAFPFSTFILTLIGVSLACRKVRGGIGIHIGLGLMISFSYILFMTFTGVLVQKGVTTSALIAVWIPNAVYAVLALFLLRKAPK
jgi:lipopolysaccharide export system permease protein